MTTASSFNTNPRIEIMNYSSSQHRSEVNLSVSPKDKPKSFFDLSSAEIEQLGIEAVESAKKRMHEKGISTIIGDGDKVIEVHPDGTKTLKHG